MLHPTASPNRRRIVAAGAGGFLSCTGLLRPAFAAGEDDGPPVVDVRGWLQRMQDAAAHRSYQGTLVFSSAGAVTSARIVHYADGAHQYERIEWLDGQMRRLYRHNDSVKAVWPEHKLVLLEPRDPVTPFPALIQPQSDDRVAEHYELRHRGKDRIAGQEALVTVLRPRDGLRFAQRVWTEKSTGLPLRVEILGPRDEVLGSSAFSEVALNVKAQPEAVLQPMRRLEGYRVLRSPMTAVALEQEGWTLKPAVPGFRLVRTVKRPLEAPGAPAAEGDRQVLQAVLSDGLTHVSLFIEPYAQARHPRALHTAVGATHTAMRRHGDWWLTLVGDVPAATLRQIAQGLERRP
jgi:sigma-E factor negative regulatory protein RseB